MACHTGIVSGIEEAGRLAPSRIWGVLDARAVILGGTDGHPRATGRPREFASPDVFMSMIREAIPDALG